MAEGTPQAFAYLNQIFYDGGPATTIQLDIGILATDGANPPLSLGISFSYDATQGVATNLAAIKAAIVAAALVEGITNMVTSNVTIFMAVN